jgi:hypothetical protein
MGGAACKRFGVERVGRDVHDLVLREIIGKMKAAAPNMRITPAPHLTAKNDFGDLDIVIDAKALEEALGKTVEEWLPAMEKAVGARGSVLGAATKALSRGGSRILEQGRGVVSLAVPCPDGCGLVQVDLIMARPDDFSSTVDYYSWGGLNNLLGRQVSALSPALEPV